MELAMYLSSVRKQRHTSELRSLEQAAKICKNGGFDHVDFSPDYRTDDWKEEAYRARAILDAAGICVEQTHAPFNRYGRDAEELFPVYYRRLFEASKILGAKYVVVHADEYRATERYDTQEILDFTYDYLAPYVDYAAKEGLVVAIENVFEDDAPHLPPIDGKSRFTSRIEELKAIIERFNTPTVGCCWDFGHAKYQFGVEKMQDALCEVGKYLCCTHVHDNHHGRDLHLMPFLGDIDWESNMALLKKLGYKGKLSFEFGYECFPDALLPIWLESVHATGEYLAGLFEAANKD